MHVQELRNATNRLVCGIDISRRCHSAARALPRLREISRARSRDFFTLFILIDKFQAQQKSRERRRLMKNSCKSSLKLYKIKNRNSLDASSNDFYRSIRSKNPALQSNDLTAGNARLTSTTNSRRFDFSGSMILKITRTAGIESRLTIYGRPRVAPISRDAPARFCDRD